MADYKKAQYEAEKIWAALKLRTPPAPIIEIANYFGLEVREVDFGNRKTLSGILDIEKKVIYLNKDDHVNHKRFTVAHELGHWILHRLDIEKDPSLTFYERNPKGGESDDKEKEANFFAANLLVPAQHLIALQDKYSDFELSRFFAVSQEVILHRRPFLRNK